MYLLDFRIVGDQWVFRLFVLISFVLGCVEWLLDISFTLCYVFMWRQSFVFQCLCFQYEKNSMYRVDKFNLVFVIFLMQGMVGVMYYEFMCFCFVIFWCLLLEFNYIWKGIMKQFVEIFMLGVFVLGYVVRYGDGSFLLYFSNIVILRNK